MTELEKLLEEHMDRAADRMVEELQPVMALAWSIGSSRPSTKGGLASLLHSKEEISEMQAHYDSVVAELTEKHSDTAWFWRPIVGA